jgi:aspartyl-tRNA(Asn)/glutamyl-tRNA(Gln) amidotransferase subunit A
MNERDLASVSALEVARRVQDRTLSAVEVTQAVLARVERLNPVLNAFITVTAEQALQEAARVDAALARGEALPLAGVPLAVKDLFATKGVRTTGGSKVLAENVTKYDATAVARLRAAGAVLIGKLNMHEFAYGFTNANPHYGDCRNPWDTARIPGGSSGGSAAAVAASLCLAALGSDTGGSIRQPAALCGIVGLKPTYGRVSRHGALTLSWTMDHAGPMTKRVVDAAAMLGVMAGHDPNDETSVHLPVPDYAATLEEPIAGLRLGIPREPFYATIEPDVAAAVDEALRVLEQRGARVVEVSLPHLDVIRGAHRAIIFAEASTYHDTWIRTRADEYGEDVRALVQAGLFLPATQYLAAQQARRRILAEWQTLWERFDVLVTPTSPIAATSFGAATALIDGQQHPLVRLYLDHTLPFNLTGQPALSVPCGFTQTGLPIGLQLVGRPFDEALLLRVAHAYERETPWHMQRPPVG